MVKVYKDLLGQLTEYALADEAEVTQDKLTALNSLLTAVTKGPLKDREHLILIHLFYNTREYYKDILNHQERGKV